MKNGEINGNEAGQTRVTLSGDSILAIGLLSYLTFLLITYIILRNKNIWLYFVHDVEFQPERWFLVTIVTYFFILPLSYYFCRRAESDLFALLLLPVVIIGGASGSIVLLFSGNYGIFFLYLIYFIIAPVFFSIIRLPTLNFPRIRIGRRGDGLFVIAGTFSILLYLFWVWKYWPMLGLPNLSEIYEFRHALDAVVDQWERYGMIFAKFIGGFSLSYLSISRRRPKYLAASISIFIFDYMLAGHRASLGFAFIVLAAYLWFVLMRRKFRIHDIVFGLAGLTALLSAALLLLDDISPYVIAPYDRTFHVSVGLFVRYLKQVEEVGLYWGGNGLFGDIFGGNGQDYRIAIGERFFGPGVSANADLVSDAYINFGIGGPFCAFLALRLLISRRDCSFFLHSREAVALFVVPYMLALFSMGLQTALVTGALAIALTIMKITSVNRSSTRASSMNAESV